MSDQIKIGLWEGETKTGVKVWKVGKPQEINGKKFWVNLYKNGSTNPNAPQLNLVLDEAEDKTQSEIVKEVMEDPFEEFGENIEIEITDDDLPF